MKLNYVIKFVDDMDRAVEFYRDVLGLPLKFQSPGWSEFVTVPDIQKFYEEMAGKGVQFSMPPTRQDFGGLLGRFVDSEGGQCSVAGE
jgi:lactoylglutathione lyase